MKNNLLNTIPLSSLNGVGAIQSAKLAKIGLCTVQDLLLHFPFRYEDRASIHKIGDLLPGAYVTVKGEILNCKINFSNSRKKLNCQISDGSGILTICFFNFNKTMKNSFIIGRYILAYGEVKLGKYGTEMIHPEYRVYRAQTNLSNNKFNELTPVYQTTEGITQSTLRRLTKQALNMLDSYAFAELLPPEISKCMMSFTEAIRILHHPPSYLHINDLKSRHHPACRRLIFEELLAYNLIMMKLHTETKLFHAYALNARDDLKNQFLASLPFKLTKAQIRVVTEIEQDMAIGIPMMRLIQGDVCSGKTLVAAFAALCAISHNKQVALMAPTEILAKQHFNSFHLWFTKLGIKVGWLVSKQKSKDRLAMQEDIANGKINMLVGTQAIFQDQIKFNDLALVIIDEQHRFGVHQRLALLEKGFQQKYRPHKLIMTATPIPRTLAMTNYDHLDVSIIDEVLPNHAKINTIIIPNTRRSDVINHVRFACASEGRQAYWVCTLIKKSDQLKAQAAEATWNELKLAIPELNIGLIHGSMDFNIKQEIIQKFRQNNINLLVTTTIIEVGVNVPNASLMIIENPERLGLAQLHQLRGRIGRGSIKSYCVLLYKSPLSKIAKRRLKIIRDNNDGFTIAKKDLEIRGHGDLLGTKQSGNAEFIIADLLRDQEIFYEVKDLARYICAFYPNQATALIDRWIPNIKRYPNTYRLGSKLRKQYKHDLR